MRAPALQAWHALSLSLTRTHSHNTNNMDTNEQQNWYIQVIYNTYKGEGGGSVDRAWKGVIEPWMQSQTSRGKYWNIC